MKHQQPRSSRRQHQPNSSAATTPEELMFDWDPQPDPRAKKVTIVDETLRDGLQGGIPRLPTLPERLGLVQRSVELGVEEAVIGFPGNPSSLSECIAIASSKSLAPLDVRLGCLGRLVAQDIENIARVRDASSRPVFALLFVGASPIRRQVEGWQVNDLVERVDLAVNQASALGLPVIFGVEDGSRTEPEVAEQLILTAARRGAEGVSCIDTTGSLTPAGTSRMSRHFKRFLREQGFGHLRLDLHGHMDRGFGIANALAGIEAGLDAVHCTALGLGERAGNYPLEHILYNLKVTGRWPGNLDTLPTYCREVSELCGVAIPHNHPIVGSGVFRTQVGLHAAAIDKAEAQGEEEMASVVYSGVSPKLVGRNYSVVVGPASGRHNVQVVLRRHKITATGEGIDRVLRFARLNNRVLHDHEVIGLAVSTLPKQTERSRSRAIPSLALQPWSAAQAVG